ncbi:MAG: DUF4145 domain-containing protein [Crocinitomicaceae bacterium]|nr:hypothetical protein [Flavobacteriales bacterium]NQZ34075.1 DUF4145 domain-containing protein [Crocinitomicaceae bacterium]
MTSNFDFLNGTHLHSELVKAEKYAKAEPRYAGLILRLALEYSVKRIYEVVQGLRLPRHSISLDSLINSPDFKEFIEETPGLIYKLNKVRSIGNEAAHGKDFSFEKLAPALKDIHTYLQWYAFEVLEIEDETAFQINLIPENNFDDTELLELKFNLEKLESELNSKEEIFATELARIVKEEAEKRKELLLQVRKQEESLIISEIGLTEQLGLIWGRVYVNFSYLNEHFHAIKYFQNEGGAVEKTKIGRGSYEDVGLYNMFSKKHPGLSSDAVLNGKFDSLKLVLKFSKQRFGTPSILLKRLIAEIELRMNKRIDRAKDEEIKDELENQFSFKGNYYLKSGVKFRNTLEISENGSSEEDKSDLIVVMLNPVGSHPLTNDPNNWHDKSSVFGPVECVPDDTQFQIVRLMNLCKYSRVLVLNLFDICDTDSIRMSDRYLVSSEKRENLKESVFHEDRRSELNEILSSSKENAPIIIGWGVSEPLGKIKSAVLDNVINKLGRRVIGWKKNRAQYYHPWPRGEENEQNRNKWPEQVFNEMTVQNN